MKVRVTVRHDERGVWYDKEHEIIIVYIEDRRSEMRFDPPLPDVQNGDTMTVHDHKHII